MSNGYFMASEACCVRGGGRRPLPINDCPANTCSRMKKTETFPAWTDELDCPSCPSNPLPHTVLTANENATPTHIPKTPQQAANSVLPIPATSARHWQHRHFTMHSKLPQNTYYSKSQQSCQPCPADSETLNTGNIDISQCKCRVDSVEVHARVLQTRIGVNGNAKPALMALLGQNAPLLSAAVSPFPSPASSPQWRFVRVSLSSRSLSIETVDSSMQ